MLILKIKKETHDEMVLAHSFLIHYLILMFAVMSIIIFIIPRSDVEAVKWYEWLAGAIIGIGFLIFIESTTVVFDKKTNRMTITNKTLLKSKVEEECSLSDIAEVGLLKNENKGTSYKIILGLKNGEKINLRKTRKKSVNTNLIEISGGGIKQSGMFTKFYEPEAAKRLAQFLDVPLREIRPPSISEFLDQTREAIRKAKRSI